MANLGPLREASARLRRVMEEVVDLEPSGATIMRLAYSVIYAEHQPLPIARHSTPPVPPTTHQPLPTTRPSKPPVPPTLKPLPGVRTGLVPFGDDLSSDDEQAPELEKPAPTKQSMTTRSSAASVGATDTAGKDTPGKDAKNKNTKEKAPQVKPTKNKTTKIMAASPKPSGRTAKKRLLDSDSDSELKFIGLLDPDISRNVAGVVAQSSPTPKLKKQKTEKAPPAAKDDLADPFAEADAIARDPNYSASKKKRTAGGAKIQASLNLPVTPQKSTKKP